MSEKLSHLYWSDDHLHAEVMRLEALNQPWQNATRRKAIQRDIAIHVFEQMERYRENNEEVEVDRFQA